MERDTLKTMEDKVIKLEAFSPEDLEKRLEEVLKADKPRPLFAELSVYGSGLLVRQFDLPPDELVNSLKMDAVEIFSLPAEEIGFDYQAIGTEQGRANGVFIAMPMKRINEFVACFKKAGLIPVKMTPRIVSAITEFLNKEKDAVNNNFCLLNFNKPNIVNLALFVKGQCELLREISYEDDDSAQKEIISSLKYGYNRGGAGKQLNKVYFTGDIAGKDEFIRKLEKKIEIKSDAQPATEAFAHKPQAYLRLLSRLNILNRHFVTLPVRNRILKIQNALILVLLLLSAFLWFDSLRNEMLARQIRPLVKAADY